MTPTWKKSSLKQSCLYLVNTASLSLADTVQGEPPSACLSLAIHKEAPCAQHPLAWHGSTRWPLHFFLLDILPKALGIAANFMCPGFYSDKCHLDSCSPSLSMSTFE